MPRESDPTGPQRIGNFLHDVLHHILEGTSAADYEQRMRVAAARGAFREDLRRRELGLTPEGLVNETGITSDTLFEDPAADGGTIDVTCTWIPDSRP